MHECLSKLETLSHAVTATGNLTFCAVGPSDFLKNRLGPVTDFVIGIAMQGSHRPNKFFAGHFLVKVGNIGTVTEQALGRS